VNSSRSSCRISSVEMVDTGGFTAEGPAQQAAQNAVMSPKAKDEISSPISF